MAMDFALNMDPTDDVKTLRIRSQEREIVIGYDDGTIFAFIQSLSKEKMTGLSSLSLDL